MERKTVRKVIDWEELFKPIEGIETNVNSYIDIAREIIPIIFVPGIMGSRLKVAKGNGKKAGRYAWNPDDAWFMGKNYGITQLTSTNRKDLLLGTGEFDKDYLEVCKYFPGDEKEKKHYKKFPDIPKVAQRGWGEVMWGSYGECLTKLQNYSWSETNRLCFEFPVHAFGYNWTASNQDSGQKLKERIDEVIKEYKEQRGRRCEHVILVTHSMGGLVARAACELHGARDQVLGVIHGVQPAMGAAAAYWRMKGGFERSGSAPKGEGWAWLRNPIKMLAHKTAGRVAAMVLGYDGEEVTALLGNMPGGLELLPNKNYTDNIGDRRWLKFPNTKGNKVVAYPKNDPYTEIYLEKHNFYRLIKPEWLGDVENVQGDEEGITPWENYAKNLAVAKIFHEKIRLKVHKQTYQFYSEGLATADCIQYSRYLHSWKTSLLRKLGIIKDDAPGKIAKTAAMGGAKALVGLKAFSPTLFLGSVVGSAIVKDSDYLANKGGYRIYTNEKDEEVEPGNDNSAFVLTLQLPGNYPEDGEEKGGDGTVPVSSGAALRKVVDHTEKVGAEDESWLLRGHEPVYQTKTAQVFTCAGIENLCFAKIAKNTGKRA